MAEIAICVVDITNPASVYLDTKLPKRGDVLCVVEDGHVWGSSELGQDNWRIIQLPGVPVAALDALLTAEIATSPPGQKGAPNTLQFRGFYLDLDHASVPAALKTWLTDPTRKVEKFLSGLSVATATALLAAIKKRRAAVADPAVIG